MKKNILSTFVAILFATTLAYTHPPDWNTQGNLITTTEWFGATGASTIPLNIMHQNTVNPQPINFFTSNTQRMTLTGNTVWLGIGTTAPCPLAPKLRTFHNLKKSSRLTL
ncbi:MAG: hypothetical protein SH856_07425 [Flavobacteriales bacterium]|nr:hypothetical protein [Flavobacteriales bacterium]